MSNSTIICHDQYGSFVSNDAAMTSREINYALGKEPPREKLPVPINLMITMREADAGHFRIAAAWQYTDNYYHPR
jgi:hypothetical protein